MRVINNSRGQVCNCSAQCNYGYYCEGGFCCPIGYTLVNYSVYYIYDPSVPLGNFTDSVRLVALEDGKYNTLPTLEELEKYWWFPMNYDYLKDLKNVNGQLLSILTIKNDVMAREFKQYVNQGQLDRAYSIINQIYYWRSNPYYNFADSYSISIYSCAKAEPKDGEVQILVKGFDIDGDGNEDLILVFLKKGYVKIYHKNEIWDSNAGFLLNYTTYLTSADLQTLKGIDSSINSTYTNLSYIINKIDASTAPGNTKYTLKDIVESYLNNSVLLAARVINPVSQADFFYDMLKNTSLFDENRLIEFVRNIPSAVRSITCETSYESQVCSNYDASYPVILALCCLL